MKLAPRFLQNVVEQRERGFGEKEFAVVTPQRDVMESIFVREP
jgi:hypothetical protein